MKHLMMYIVIAMVLFLSACSEETAVEQIETEEVHAAEVESAEAIKEKEEAAEKEAAAKEKEEADKAAAEAAKKAEAALAEENAQKAEDIALLGEYADSMTNYMGNLADHLEQLSVLTIDAGNDPTLIASEEWTMGVVVSLLSMEEQVRNIRAIEPPAQMAKSHELTLLAMDEYQFVVDNFPDAIDNMDADLIERCTIAIQEGTRYTEQATAQLDEDLGL